MRVAPDTVPDHPTRRAAVAAALAAHDADAVVVSDLTNVRYLTGFTGSNAAVLIWRDDPSRDRIATDGRYTAQVAEQSPDLEAMLARDTIGALVERAGAAGTAVRVAFEADAVTVGDFGELCTAVEASPVELVPVRGLVQALREVKDAGETALVEAACRIGDEALAALVERGAVAPGRTEREVARDLEWEMYARGAAAIAFETIVAAGPNSAVPHHRPTSDVLAAGDFVKIDFGAVVDGYHSDMTRTAVLGEPAPWQREIYEIVRQAQAAGRAALVPGAALAEIDAAAREVIAASGYGEQYVHGLGHGVGLEIHEAPGIGSAARGTLRDGAIVTVEPGIYLPGRGGVRIEDTLVVSDAGPRSLTNAPRALLIL
ncbi:aminopeptidase P family protein [Gordonia alkaliphila]|uniref:Xaa-Pro peptidase family protein n=1 Tax=Gordonia alkaliphila TaxID=1053547 RepID=A0ABP8YX41_9ACTN